MKKFNILCVILLVLCSPSVIGQQSGKKQLSENDYGKWGTLSIKNISTLGRWTSYEMNYDNANDTLFLQNTDSKEIYAYPKGNKSSFGGEEVFGFLNGSDLTLVSLKKYRLTHIKSVQRFEILNNGAYIVTHHQDNSLQIRSSKGIVLKHIEHVSTFKMNPINDALIYSQEINEYNSVGCIRFDTYDHSDITTELLSFDSFTWEEKGRSVVFSNGDGLLYYNLEDKRLLTFNISSLSGYEDASILKNGLTGLRISNDGLRVFFSIARPLTKSKMTNNASANIEIWNGNDSILYPLKQELGSRDTPKLVVWNPSNGISKVLSNDSLHRVRLTGGSNYVLLSNPYSYGLEPNYYVKVDYYLKNIQTGVEKVLLKKQSHDPNMLCVAPYSDIMVYYLNKNWWLYNPVEATTRNLTQGINTTWDNDNDAWDAPNQFKAYGLAGWSSDGKSVLIYDEFDIWEFSLYGSIQKRLTYGREEEKVYRINRIELEKHPSRNYDSGLLRSLNLNDPILLDCSDSNGYSGYSLYSKSTGVKSIVFENKFLNGIKRSNNGRFVFSSQTFSQSPQVTFLKEGSIPKTLFKSNKQQVNYYYGRSELISYKNSKGRQLKGVLLYPADYQVGNDYPMIVYVYEQLSHKLHQYVNPSLLNSQGFSVTNYTLNGYFVLMPDIVYELGNPGISASDCITSATKSVIANFPIEPAKIGLIGHSFGGFETIFTITQTDLFAASVSGAGLSDPIRHYFELNKNGSSGSDTMWKFEKQQMRFGDSFFNSKENYWNNTSLTNAEKITTPLLQWFGKDDKVIPGEQSISLYLALRRLGLPNMLLIYPNEAHNIFLHENQIDLTKKIRQWFDYYLNEKEKPNWVEY